LTKFKYDPVWSDVEVLLQTGNWPKGYVPTWAEEREVEWSCSPASSTMQVVAARFEIERLREAVYEAEQRASVAEEELATASDVNDSLRAEVERLREENKSLLARARKGEANYRYMVEKLEGYRELGARAAVAENERDHARAEIERLRTDGRESRISLARELRETLKVRGFWAPAETASDSDVIMAVGMALERAEAKMERLRAELRERAEVCDHDWADTTVCLLCQWDRLGCKACPACCSCEEGARDDQS
jgi:chromosome segregation ATPase